MMGLAPISIWVSLSTLLLIQFQFVFCLDPARHMNCTDTSRLCTSFLAFDPLPNQTLAVIESMFDVGPDDLTVEEGSGRGYVFVKKNCSCMAPAKNYLTYTTFTIRSSGGGFAYDLVSEAYGGLAFLPNVTRRVRNGTVVSLRLLCGCSSGPWNYLVSYVMREGDSVESLASRFGVSMVSIDSVNGIGGPDNVTVGGSYYVPLNSATQNQSFMMATIRPVWANNLDEEIRIMEDLLPYYPIVSFDTEFPGTVDNLNIPKSSYSKLSPSQTYNVMRSNVGRLDLIQLGLTLSDPLGNSCVWEFNFSDFDLATSDHNPDSIDLLKRQGIDFNENRESGIRFVDFAERVLRSGLFRNGSFVTWVTFHGAYDFGFLVKALNRGDLPLELSDFLVLVQHYFGERIYDLKHVVKCCDGLYGGLERVAKAVGVERVAGRSHQAGSDSLLTMHTFFELIKRLMFSSSLEKMWKQGGIIHGLELERKEAKLQQPWLVPMSSNLLYGYGWANQLVCKYTHT